MDNDRAEDALDDCSACAELRHLGEEGCPADRAPAPPAAPQGQGGGGRALRDIERAYISRIFEETNHNLAKAARILEIDRSTLYSKLRKYGLK